MSRPHRALALLVLCLALVSATTAVAAATQPTPPAIEDQHDRLLRNLQAGQAERTEAAVELTRSMERNLAPLPAVNGMATQPAPRADTAVPGWEVNVLATLLLGLSGGLVGGAVMPPGLLPAGVCSGQPPRRDPPLTRSSKATPRRALTRGPSRCP